MNPEVIEEKEFFAEVERRKRIILNRLSYRLDMQAHARAERDMWKLDRASFDNLFPRDAVPGEILAILDALGRKFGVPFGASLAAMLTTSSGFLGLHKARIVNPCDPKEFINPGISSIHVGESGNGKTELSKFFLEPIRAYNADSINRIEDIRIRKRAIQKEIEQIQNAETFTDDDKRRAERLELELLLLDNGGASYIADFVSVPSITAQIYTNSIQARIDERPQPGFILAKQDASSLLNNGKNLRDVKSAGDLYSLFNNLLDGIVDDPTRATRKTQGKTTKNGIVAYFEIQPELASSLACAELQANGFLNRFLYVYYPETVGTKLERRLNLSKERDNWEQIIRYIHNFNGGAFYCAESDELERYLDRLDELATKASRDGNSHQYAFCKKLFFVVHQIALQLHLWNLALRRDTLDNSLMVEIDGVTVPQWAVIPAETISAAVKLCEYYRETRDIVWNLVKYAVSPKITQRRDVDNLDDIDVTGKELSGKLKDVYNYAMENGTKYDLLKPGDQLGRVISKNSLRRKNYYKDPANQGTFEREAFRRCLMFPLPPKGKNDQGARFFLPDNLTREQLLEWKRSQSKDEAEAT